MPLIPVKHLFLLLVVVLASYFITSAPWKEALANEQATTNKTASAIFAGGCFWCTEADFEKVKGVISATSGYTGGTVENPTYKQVSYTETGHYEAVKVEYDPAIVSYEQLLSIYWKSIDPTDPHGQFCDKGSSYRSAIFTASEQQKTAATASLKQLQDNKPFSESIATVILDASTFWPAETYHQDYYKKNPIRYKFYRTGCGRDKRLKQLWGKQ